MFSKPSANSTPANCTHASRLLRRTYVDQGVTFDLGAGAALFPLDIVPRIVQAAEWAVVEAGVKQRVLALEKFLDDVYGEGRVFTDGVMPRKVVTTSHHFHRAAHGFNPLQRGPRPRRRGGSDP